MHQKWNTETSRKIYFHAKWRAARKFESGSKNGHALVGAAAAAAESQSVGACKLYKQSAPTSSERRWQYFTIEMSFILVRLSVWGISYQHAHTYIERRRRRRRREREQCARERVSKYTYVPTSSSRRQQVMRPSSLDMTSHTHHVIPLRVFTI